MLRSIFNFSKTRKKINGSFFLIRRNRQKYFWHKIGHFFLSLLEEEVRKSCMNKIENKETIAGLKSTIKVMTQRVNGLNTPFKRKKEILMDLIKKLTSNIWYIEETLLRYREKENWN